MISHHLKSDDFDPSWAQKCTPIPHNDGKGLEIDWVILNVVLIQQQLHQMIMLI